MNRNIRVADQRERGSGTFVVFYTVPRPNGASGTMRVGMDLIGKTPDRATAYRIKDAIAAIPDADYTYETAWAAGAALDKGEE